MRQKRSGGRPFCRGSCARRWRGRRRPGSSCCESLLSAKSAQNTRTQSHARNKGNEKGASFRDERRRSGNEERGNLQLDPIIAGGKIDLSLSVDGERETPLSTKRRQKAALPLGTCAPSSHDVNGRSQAAAANSVNRKEATTTAATSDELVLIHPQTKLPALMRAAPPPPIEYRRTISRHSCARSRPN